MLGSECPKVCECGCHTFSPPSGPSPAPEQVTEQKGERCEHGILWSMECLSCGPSDFVAAPATPALHWPFAAKHDDCAECTQGYEPPPTAARPEADPVENPWIKLIGKYKDDPTWGGFDEFLKQYGAEMDRIYAESTIPPSTVAVEALATEIFDYVHETDGGYKTDFTQRHLIEIISKHLVAQQLPMTPQQMRQQLAEAAREIPCAGPIAHRIRVLKREHEVEIARLNSEVERLKGELWHFKMDQLQACEGIRDIQQIACPDCQDPIGLHAVDSRIVGCQAGDGSEEDPICGCRTLYGEAIQRTARADAIKEAVEVVESYADSIGNPSANVIAALEALKTK